MDAPKTDRLSLFPLMALVVGSMIGSGIFSLPQNMAESSGAVAIVIAWIITFVGMLCLAKVFQNLALKRTDINTGPYGYAREGFGDYIGFSTAWGMWISAMAGNAGYLVLFFAGVAGLSSLSLFGQCDLTYCYWLRGFASLNAFGDGTTGAAIIGALVLLWIVHFLVLRGVSTAAFVNTIVTIAKIAPVLFFIAVGVAFFQGYIFREGMWGPGGLKGLIDKIPNVFNGGIIASPEARSLLLDQVKGSMLYTVWIFIGIESASIYASRAKDMVTVGRATAIGFIITITLYMAVSLLSLGIVPQEVLAKMPNPSMREVITHALGPWSANIISVGVIISVGGAFLAWTMLAAELIFNTSRGESGTGPHTFKKTNAAGAPSSALWWTNFTVTLMLIVSWKFKAGYNELILLATSMTLVPYFLSSLFAFLTAKKEQKIDARFMLISLISSFYGVWLIYAAGMKYLLVSMVLYAVGIPFFLYGRRDDKLPFFAGPREVIAISLVVILGVVGGYQLYTGGIKL